MSENNSEQNNIRGILDEVISEAGDSTPNAPAADPAEDAQKALRDEALFKSIEKKKRKKRNRIIRTVVIILLILFGAGFYGVSYLRHKVQVNSVSNLEDVTTYAATVGSISTTVSGSGTLSNVDEEYIRVPDSVEIDDVVVEVNDKLEKGDIIAKLDMATVRSAIATVQGEIEELDEQIYDAATETIDVHVVTGVKGRIKALYGTPGVYVSDCMYENGALALLSLDGYMAVDIDSAGLSLHDKVKVIRGNEEKKEITGEVESILAGKAVVLVTDNGPALDELVTVETEDGLPLGSGKLYVHKPMRITGIAGRISYVNASLNQPVSKGDVIYILDETNFSATYESLIVERADKEETLLELMQLNKDGALLAPFSGSVGKVIYDDGDTPKDTSSSSSSSSSYAGMGVSMMSSFAGMGAAASMGAASTTSTDTETTATEEGKTDVIKLSPDELMEVSISVDESHILSLEVGQTATVSVNSIGDDTFSGILTEIDKTANSASGVTRYSAVISMKKDERMLPGMTAKAVVRIQGVDNAIIIPVDALHQTSSTSYVYTSYDPELAEFGGIVKVEAGISNTSYVEITDGLQEGDVVYYVETEKDMFGFGMGGGMPSGGRPGGSGGRR
ncbi:MAG: hypothetical protein Q4F31_03580 [Eubacteriales bacterium]|nr:hypothetical protein [Eubacteriales bacterium]